MIKQLRPENETVINIMCTLLHADAGPVPDKDASKGQEAVRNLHLYDDDSLSWLAGIDAASGRMV